MFLRARSLIQGYSGVRPELVTTIVEFLNAGITPCVPFYGSVGASGDLCPLSHIALGLIGEGRGHFEGKEYKEIGLLLAKQGVTPISLEMKEGLALNNGMQFSLALGILAWSKCYSHLQSACLNTALGIQVMLGSDDPFLQEVHELRPHPGAQQVASWIRAIVKDSPIRESHRDYRIDGQIQDPYNLRCSPQILGACHDLLMESKATFEIEANSVTDNPLILEQPAKTGIYTRIISAGHFHGMPIATKIYNLMQTLGIMARLSNMRCARYVDEARNRGLGKDLIWPELDSKDQQTASGMMIPEYVSASLTNSIWGECMPSHLFSLSTDAGQEDHVSMATGLAVRLWKTIPRLSEVLAIELAYASQAAAIRKARLEIPCSHKIPHGTVSAVAKENYERALSAELKDDNFYVSARHELVYKVSAFEMQLSPCCEVILERVCQIFPPVLEDRTLSDQLIDLAALVNSGELNFWYAEFAKELSLSNSRDSGQSETLPQG